MVIGEYIKTLRLEKNYSQRELAELTGVSNSELSRIESGQRQNPSPLFLKSLALYLDVSLEDLMKVAGYTSEVIPRGAFDDVVFRDENGNIIDSYRQKVQNILEKDEDLINILDRAIKKSSDNDIELIKKLLTGFTRGAMSQREKELLKVFISNLKIKQK